VVDSAYNRIMIFDVLANWPTDGTPPAAKSIVGQANACPTLYANQACKAVNNGNLAGTTGLEFSKSGEA